MTVRPVITNKKVEIFPCNQAHVKVYRMTPRLSREMMQRDSAFERIVIHQKASSIMGSANSERSQLRHVCRENFFLKLMVAVMTREVSKGLTGTHVCQLNWM